MELLTSGRYGRYLQVTDTGQVRLDPHAIRQAQRLDGKWVLFTNDDTLSIQDAALAYKSLRVIERCFRSLKRGQIYLGPMYHRTPKRIEAHVKLCVLALLIRHHRQDAYTASEWLSTPAANPGFIFSIASIAFRPSSSEPLPTDFSSVMNPPKNSGIYSKSLIFQCLNKSYTLSHL
jgi:hypothetical protein